MFDVRQLMKLDTTMSFQATVLRRYCWVILFWGLAAGSVLAQAPDSPVAFANQDAITASFVQAPNLGGTGAPVPGDHNWLKVEFHYGVAFPIDPNVPQDGPTALKYLDEVQFKVWIEGRDLLDPQGKPGEGIAVVLTGSVTYINIPKGHDRYGVFYVHPDTLGRYGTVEGTRDFDANGKFDIHLEAYVAGKLMDSIDKKKGETAGWQLQPKQIPGLVYRQNQTPFVCADVDRYPAIKLDSAQ